MANKVRGHLHGLSASSLKQVERLYRRSPESSEVVPFELAREIYRTAHNIGRRIGVLISREGEIAEVFVGKREILYLPDLGRYRLGRGRLRRLRLVFSDLSSRGDRAHIPGDIYADLEKLRLDMVVSVRETKNRVAVAYAYMAGTAESQSSPVRTENCEDLSRLKLDFQELMSSVEEQLCRELPAEAVREAPQAMLIGVYDKRSSAVENSMRELHELARTAGVRVLGSIIQKRDLDPRTLLGKGKLEEVMLASQRRGADLLIFDNELRPGQWRAVTNSTELRVIDRSMLILDIFAQRAQSSEGRLQVELAQLKYNLPRLVEKDTGLSRLTGGIGGRGPGETKLEIGRRRIRDRIIDLEARIEKLSAQRSLRRARRKQSAAPLVSILGYTNAGKSTLFNALTRSSVLVEDRLFATLDPAQRRLCIPGPGGSARLEVVLADTVGFIRDLPAELRTAFRATLEELHEASLLVHVLDASESDLRARKDAVERILAEMELLDLPLITVLNKVDRCDNERLGQLTREFDALPVSAVNRQGFAPLLDRIQVLIGSGGNPALLPCVV